MNHFKDQTHFNEYKTISMRDIIVYREYNGDPLLRPSSIYAVIAWQQLKTVLSVVVVMY